MRLTEDVELYAKSYQRLAVDAAHKVEEGINASTRGGGSFGDAQDVECYASLDSMGKRRRLRLGLAHSREGRRGE